MLESIASLDNSSLRPHGRSYIDRMPVPPLCALKWFVFCRAAT